MSTKIKIGADELILWLRKNGKLNYLPNNEIHGLGVKIHNLIVKRLGCTKMDDGVSYWENSNGTKNVGKYDLPKTSAQYEVATEKLGELFEELSTW